MKKTTDELLNSLKSSRNYSDFFKEEMSELQFKSLSEYLDFLTKSKKLKKSEIITKSNIDKTYAYQIFNGTKVNPSRDKIIMLAFGMGLNNSETAILLKNAKQPELYVRDIRDSIIIFCIEKKMSLIEANENLLENGMDLLE